MLKTRVHGFELVLRLLNTLEQLSNVGRKFFKIDLSVVKENAHRSRILVKGAHRRCNYGHVPERFWGVGCGRGSK